MSDAIWLLLGLLLLSYLGSFLFGGHVIRGIGLPSGVEYVVLGFVVGPAVLGALERSTLASFDSIARVAVGWLMLVVGVTYGSRRGRRVRPSRLLGGCLAALFTGGLVGALVWLAIPLRAELDPLNRLLLAGGIGAVSAETTRSAVRWVVERHQASGPLSELIGDLAEGDDLVSLLALAALFALVPAELAIPVSRPALVLITIALGVVLGGIAAALLRLSSSIEEAWGVLLGVSLLAIGVSTRLGLSTITSMFALGLTLSLLSPNRGQLAAMMEPTERPVMLPALLLAGAHVDFAAAPWIPAVAGLALAARVLAKGLVGAALVASWLPARRAGARLGLGLLPSGALTMSVGFAFAMRFPGAIGDAVLVAASVITLFGEFVGLGALRGALARAGEIGEEVAPSAVPPPGEAA